MATRSQGKTRGRARGRGRARKNDAEMPDVYQEMLADVDSSPTRKGEQGRPIKKRRIGGQLVVSREGKVSDVSVESAMPKNEDKGMETDASMVYNVSRPKQTIYNDSDDSEDSDMDWEDVQFQAEATAPETEDEPGGLSLVMGGEKDEGKKGTSSNRKSVTSAERQMRLEIHKMHLLSLLSHVHLRNHWCNDAQVQDSLLKLLNKRTRSYLDDDESQSQFQRSRSLTDGLEQASEAFRTSFQLNARGMSRCYWAEDAEQLAQLEVPGDIDLPMQKLDFREAALKLQGSRDIGAQLFCAMLRATGAEVRLVCSLQPLPFTAAAKGTTPIKPGPAFTTTYPETRIGMDGEDSGHEGASDVSTDGSKKSTPVRPRITSRIGRPAARIAQPAPIVAPKPAQRKKKPIRESPYPIFWVEVFSTALQKWLPVDPIVTKNIAKSSKFEPPASDLGNSLSYVLAFEEDGSARDVTKWYTRAYNAKTRRQRVESTKEGEKWWKRVMRMYKRPYALDRDMVEDAELAGKEAIEGMPKNIAEFKNHPHYALGRHLRRNEVIHPKREVGKVSAARLADGDRAVESVYRRRDVHVVKSEDAWYRLGREVKDGEEALKVVVPRRRKDPLFDEDASEAEESVAGTLMYAAFQTITYKAPPVVNGRIPRNVYGNLDIYVASMIPAGGVHIAHPDTARAARILGIDYADAVTGFEFRGRTGTAVVKGAVVAGEYYDAVVETIQGLEYAREEEEMMKRSLEALRLWKRFLMGLRIKERIEGYTIEGEQHEPTGDENDDDYKDEGDEEGGFLADGTPDRELPEPMEQAVPHFVPHPIVSTWGVPRELLAPQTHPMPKHHSPEQHESGGFTIDDTEEDQGGGFIENNGGGGFIPSTTTERDQRTSPSTAPKAKNPRSQSQGIRSSTSPPIDLPSHDLLEARLLQQLQEIERSEATTTTDNEASSIKANPSNPSSMQVAEPATIPGEKLPSNAPPPSFERSKSSEGSASSDKGSLLSHDPEDDDADPEWLT